MENKLLTCEDAREVDLVDYLFALGFQPQKIRGNDYWYLSPLREEKEASFKVNRKLNVWYDHGIGKGGDLIDFGVLYHNINISELLQRLKQNRLFFHPHPSTSQTSFDAGEKEKIKVVDEREIVSQELIDYLSEKRKVSLDVARGFCRQIDFILYGKKHTAIGFKNNRGGYELRNEYFKGSSSPKDITFIENNCSNKCSVFEGFFSFLSFQMLAQKDKKISLQLSNEQPNFLILNSLSFLEKSRKLMEKHDRIHLYLDRDKAGLQATRKALKWSTNYIDKSPFYKRSKDINDYLIKQHKREELKQSHRSRMKFSSFQEPAMFLLRQNYAGFPHVADWRHSER